MPMYDFKCDKCAAEIASLEKVGTENIACPVCKSEMHRTPSTFGGYYISGDNSASQRPKTAGSRKGKK